jgi:hypothetical protein
MWTDSTLQVINDNDQYIGVDGTTYPWNFPKSEIPGLFAVMLAPSPDKVINEVHGFHITEDHVQQWDFSPLTEEQIKEGAEIQIQSQIDELERNAMENRGSRELHLREMEREAAAEAAAASTPDAPVTADQVLAQVPYYVKLKALDDQISALRAQL